jgi:hypothetical protein
MRRAPNVCSYIRAERSRNSCSPSSPATLPLLPGDRGGSATGRAARLREGAGEARQLAAEAVLHVAQGGQEERGKKQGRPREITLLRVAAPYPSRMAKREPTTEELRRAQRERITEEHEAIPNSITPDEERQHRRRAEKSAYLERMLAARERSERERDLD